MKKIIKTYYVFDKEDKKSIRKQMVDLNLTVSRLARKIYISDGLLYSILEGRRRFKPEFLEALKNQDIIINEGE